MSDPIDGVIKERRATHGDPYDNAAAYHALQVAWTTFWKGERVEGWVVMPADMMLNKLARIIAGDWSYADHWRDIEGYARIVRQRLEQEDGKRGDLGSVDQR